MTTVTVAFHSQALRWEQACIRKIVPGFSPVSVLYKTFSAAVYGIDANIIELEVDVSGAKLNEVHFHTTGASTRKSCWISFSWESFRWTAAFAEFAERCRSRSKHEARS